ncbi:zinc chelation protein SecC [Stappia sp. GBMRC 2046]|uniref:Zinc chelation protein SecC n=1 Tax=Stappia sediminis TaxID=2692190 RepID=A0A7X3LU10_9HYPH|nr:YchJ family metal-binding protein [Stappia sediminis]MXN65079.1 zinc chelation protein SecC [Stappia sediminis]
MPDPCPCGSKRDYDACCGRFHSGEGVPETAEELMRSRYSAYVRREMDYLEETLWPAKRRHFDKQAAERWATESAWVGLSVLKSEAGGKDDARGTVLFIARFFAGGDMHEHRELSLFRKKSGRWYYVEGLPES